MKERFVKFIRDLREPVRAQRQEKIREAELAWSAEEFAAFRLFAMGIHSSEKADICHALSDAQAAPLLELLADFAEKDTNLINAAFEAMEKTSQEGRLFLAKKLITSPKSEVRARTCKLLGRAGQRGRSLLEHALMDQDGEVRLAAVKAILRGGFKSLVPRIPALLHDDDKEVRFAALEVLARLNIQTLANENDLLSILSDDSQEAPARRLAAEILARASNKSARTILLDALRADNASASLRMAAAESLCAYNDLEAITTVIRAVYDLDPDIAQTATMALNRKGPGNFETILAKILSGDDVRLARYAAELLGSLDTSLAKNTLLERLNIERRIPVINAIASAMGKGNVSGAWDALISVQKKENIDDPNFFAALADAACEENLSQYASFFDVVNSAESKRAIINRLAYFALTSPVSPEMHSLAIKVLNDSDKSLYIFAASILAHNANLTSEEITLVLTRLAVLGNDSQIQGIVLALLRNKHGALAEIFLKAPPESCQILAYAATKATSMGNDGELLFSKVANWAANGTPFANEALRNMAALAPQTLTSAMTKTDDQIFLIEAWGGLPEQDRAAHRPNFRAFFTDASPEDALTAINILKDSQDQRSLQDLADVAFTSKYPEVRQAALKRTREFILAE